MNNLVIMKNQQAVTSSFQVAETFEKKHRNVLATIEGLLKNKHTQHMFAKETYINEQNGQSYPIYYMNRDGFTLLAMGFTGTKELKFKLKYIEAFNAMEQTLKELPVEKLDPVVQAEISMTKAKTAKANALYKIAKATDSKSASQSLLAQAAKELTGEMTILVMKRKEYTATEVGERVGKTANKVGRICNQLGLKAEQPGQNKYGRWVNGKSKYSPHETPQWLYFDKGVEAIKNYLASQPV
ncbi:Rha family transcriptional regulator [Lactiplantibacillus plantarum]|uniref:Rha family transcriptional regulator n=1 Tax=Lactiplantibacillus plantarum TaxID=1590 RepID=UPI001BAAF4F1|nr:Rha family transcriptional regulator [Lactiplantibacillus plantarum]MBS0937410.1 Rha family transcriptional regulator [Lactiplantibacillus plantarum]MBS0945546.1 Rha family transcriptional regulator [Lactiplantibacillus plantarum]